MDFQLVGHSSELKKYVGQRVEVRGIVEPMKENRSGDSSGTSGTSGSTSDMGKGTSSSQSGGSMGNGQGETGSQQSGGSMSGGSQSGQQSYAGSITHRVKVSSVKSVSSSCQ